MSLTLIISVAGAVLVAGSIIAVLWWGLAKKVAPYRDELERQKQREQAAKDEQVIVIDSPGKPKP
jgi:hypothetical protein